MVFQTSEKRKTTKLFFNVQVWSRINKSVFNGEKIHFTIGKDWMIFIFSKDYSNRFEFDFLFSVPIESKKKSYISMTKIMIYNIHIKCSISKKCWYHHHGSINGNSNRTIHHLSINKMFINEWFFMFRIPYQTIHFVGF